MAALPLFIDQSTLGFIRSHLDAIGCLPPRSPQKTVQMRQVVQTLKVFRPLTFSANNGMPLYPSQVGGYRLAAIPSGKSGHLKPLRGQMAIVVCVGSGTNRTRKYMAAPIA